MPLRFGDVIVVPFPFTDQSAIKKRPAVVVSSESYHRDRPDLILMAITSQVRQIFLEARPTGWVVSVLVTPPECVPEGLARTPPWRSIRSCAARRKSPNPP